MMFSDSCANGDLGGLQGVGLVETIGIGTKWTGVGTIRTGRDAVAM